MPDLPLGLRARIAIVLAVAAIATACSRTPGPARPDTTSHFAGDELAFDYPTSWNAAHFDVSSSFSSVIVYLSTEGLSDPCDRTANSVACVRSGVSKLGENGVLVTWTHWGFPGGDRDQTPGRDVTVDGRTGTLRQGDATDGCEEIGGVRQLSVVVEVPEAADNWIQLDACLAGPTTDATQALVESMLRSVVWKERR